eukprot:10864828-Karenia_brevis.AAC.1
MSQLLQSFLFPDTTDVDIHNCMMTMSLQTIEHLDLLPEFAELFQEELMLLHQLVVSRDEIIHTKLRKTKAVGKQQIMKVISGGRPPSDYADEERPFWNGLCKLSRFLRWIAMSTCPDEYEILHRDPEVKWSEGS